MSNTRDNYLWLQLWQENHTAFHQTSVNALLTKYWPQFDANKNSRVFIPLCGKSLDILWLAQQGHQVIGVELSPIAVRAFFEENNLVSTQQKSGLFTLWQHQNISILCGDFFALSQSDLGHIDSVYDRAALTALPEDLRQPYIHHLHTLIPTSCNIFLLTVEDIEQSTTTSLIDSEITTLYSSKFDIKLTCVENAMGLVPTVENVLHDTEYKVYELIHKI
ncbi:thiopurine S-methyltransferase [Methylophaga sp.]|uniref:thiopurine S-methyltransferase n=1 Tax=Methylophaga sp. TaxID=2024840 RepID=UPI002718C02C|nr:thiopurine S-methyltransferase [Methylophaga sp.]MDO8828060.1 thiopurine S-methyltransferase [Methylophaga sp.]